MSGFGRAYLALVALRSLGLTGGILANLDRYETAPAFDVLVAIAPLDLWAAAFAVVGVAALGGVVFPDRARFLTFLVASITLTSTWAAGFFLSLTWTTATTSYLTFALTDVLALRLPALPRPSAR